MKGDGLMDPGGCSIFIITLLQMLALNAAFAFDNAAVLLMAANGLERKDAVKAISAGISGAIILRLLFAVVLAKAVDLSRFPLSFIGGIILIMLTLKMTADTSVSKGKAVMVSVIMTIILGDLWMSLDNTIALVVLAKGNILLLVLGLLSNIPIILGLVYLGEKALKWFPPVIYIAAALLAYTGIGMIVSDQYINNYVNLLQYSHSALVAAGLVILYGVINTDWQKCWLTLKARWLTLKIKQLSKA